MPKRIASPQDAASDGTPLVADEGNSSGADPSGAEASEPDIQVAPDERDLAALDIIGELCAVSGLGMTADIRGVEGSYLKIELVGDEAARIFGAHGRMLDALQFLANLIISRRLGPGVRVLLDAGGYRERRLKMLTDLAHEYAEEVKARSEECEIDSLPPHERRIIHKLLSEDPDVITYSEGEEPDRRIVIAPRVNSA